MSSILRDKSDLGKTLKVSLSYEEALAKLNAEGSVDKLGKPSASVVSASSLDDPPGPSGTLSTSSSTSTVRSNFPAKSLLPYEEALARLNAMSEARASVSIASSAAGEPSTSLEDIRRHVEEEDDDYDDLQELSVGSHERSLSDDSQGSDILASDDPIQRVRKQVKKRGKSIAEPNRPEVLGSSDSSSQLPKNNTSSSEATRAELASSSASPSTSNTVPSASASAAVVDEETSKRTSLLDAFRVRARGSTLADAAPATAAAAPAPASAEHGSPKSGGVAQPTLTPAATSRQAMSMQPSPAAFSPRSPGAEPSSEPHTPSTPPALPEFEVELSTCMNGTNGKLSACTGADWAVTADDAVEGAQVHDSGTSVVEPSARLEPPPPRSGDGTRESFCSIPPPTDSLRVSSVGDSRISVSSIPPPTLPSGDISHRSEPRPSAVMSPSPVEVSNEIEPSFKEVKEPHKSSANINVSGSDRVRDESVRWVQKASREAIFAVLELLDTETLRIALTHLCSSRLAMDSDQLAKHVLIMQVAQTQADDKVAAKAKLGTKKAKSSLSNVAKSVGSPPTSVSKGSSGVSKSSSGSSLSDAKPPEVRARKMPDAAGRSRSNSAVPPTPPSPSTDSSSPPTRAEVVEELKQWEMDSRQDKADEQVRVKTAKDFLAERTDAPEPGNNRPQQWLDEMHAQKKPILQVPAKQTPTKGNESQFARPLSASVKSPKKNSSKLGVPVNEDARLAAHKAAERVKQQRLKTTTSPAGDNASKR